MERPKNSAQLLDLRDRLAWALQLETPDVSRARERILELKFFESPKTPAPAPVIDLSASRLRPRF